MKTAHADCPLMCKMQYNRIGGTKACSLNAMNGKLGETKVINGISCYMCIRIKQKISLYYLQQHDIESILVETAAGKGLLKIIGMDKEICWAYDADDAAVDGWTKIIQKGKKKNFFEAQFNIDVAARTAPVESPTIPAIRESAEADADSVEAAEVEDLKELEGRLMNAIRDGLKEVNQYAESLGNQLTPIENEVRSLRMSVPEMSVRDAGVLDIAKQMPSQHGEGNDEEDSSSKDETWKKIVVLRMMTWKKRVVIKKMTWKKRVVPRMMTLKR